MNTPKNSFFPAISTLFAGLADLSFDGGPTETFHNVCKTIAGAAGVLIDAEAGGLPSLRERVARDIRFRRGALIQLARGLSPLGVRSPSMQEGMAFVHPELPELEAEAARLYQLEDLLPFMGRDALLVTLGATSTRDGRSDYLALERVLFDGPEHPEPPAAANSRHCTCAECCASTTSTESAA